MSAETNATASSLTAAVRDVVAAVGGPTLVAGIDSSTQSTKVVLVDVEDGTIVAQASAPHPEGTEVDPVGVVGRLAAGRVRAAGAGRRRSASAVSSTAWSPSMPPGAVVRPALLWNDLRSAPQADEVIEHLGGPAACADAIGSVPTASFTVTKLRWMAEHEPDNAARTAAVLLAARLPDLAAGRAGRR